MKEKRKENEISQYLKDKNILDLKNDFDQLNLINIECSEGREADWIDSGISSCFEALSEIDINLYKEALNLLIRDKYSFSLSYGSMIVYPMRKNLIPKEELYDIINKDDYIQKEWWKRLFLTI